VLERWGSRTFVVLHRGEVVTEHVSAGHDPARLQKCYSITKSMIGTVAAELIVQDVVSRDTAVVEVLPELDGSAFDGIAVGHLADMTVPLAYIEDYAEIAGGSSGRRGLDFGDYVVALGMEEDGVEVAAGAARSIRELLPRLEAPVSEGAAPVHPGAAFQYATPVTDVLGWLIERIVGVDAATLVEQQIWASCGASASATWDLDRAGTPMVGAGLAMTTRDLARIGTVLAECARGEGADGSISRAALDEVRRGGSLEAFAADEHYAYLEGYSYRDQWWIPQGPDAAFSGWGIYGQFLWVDPDADLVLACHGRGGTPADPARDAEQHALCAAITEAVAGR
jgi:CubicO group peptidase (beta-lactamase class C family)